jgi:hypothetical protein
MPSEKDDEDLEASLDLNINTEEQVLLKGLHTRNSNLQTLPSSYIYIYIYIYIVLVSEATMEMRNI